MEIKERNTEVVPKQFECFIVIYTIASKNEIWIFKLDNLTRIFRTPFSKYDTKKCKHFEQVCTSNMSLIKYDDVTPTYSALGIKNTLNRSLPPEKYMKEQGRYLILSNLTRTITLKKKIPE